MWFDKSLPYLDLDSPDRIQSQRLAGREDQRDLITQAGGPGRARSQQDGYIPPDVGQLKIVL